MYHVALTPFRPAVNCTLYSYALTARVHAVVVSHVCFMVAVFKNSGPTLVREHARVSCCQRLHLYIIILRPGLKWANFF